MNVVGTDRQDRTGALLFTFIGALTALIYLIGGFLPLPSTWGFHHLAFLPAAIRIAVALFMAALTLPVCQSLILRWIQKATGYFSSKSKTSKRVFLFALFLFAVFILWMLREKFFLLGDGSLVIRIITGQQPNTADASVFRNEPLAGYLMISISKLFSGAFPGIPDEYPIQMTVIAFALVCLFFAWKLACALVEDHTERILSYGCIVSSGTLPLLFGYVEIYMPVYCGILIFITFSLRYLNGTSPLILPAAAYGILFCLHFGSLVFLPIIGILIFHNARMSKGRDIPLAVFVVLALSVLILWYLEYPLQKFIALFSGSGKHVLFMKSSAFPAQGYGFLSVPHIINIINFLIQMGIFSVGSVFLLRRDGFKERSDGFRFLLLTLLVTAGILFVLFFRSEIGMSRDWDILAVFYSGCIVTAVWYVTRSIVDYAGRCRLLVMMGGIILLQSSSLVIVNSREEWAKTRFEVLPDETLWPRSGMLSAYEELSIYYRGRHEPQNALMYLFHYRDLDSTNPRIFRSIAHLYSLLNDRLSEINYLRQALELIPYDWALCVKLGSAYGTVGNHDKSLLYLQRAYALQPMSPLVNFSLGMAIVNSSNDCINGSKYFHRALALDSSYLEAYVGLADCAVRTNDTASARAYKAKYLKLKPAGTPSPEIRRMLNGVP